MPGHPETTGPQVPCHKGGLMSDPASTGKLGTTAAIKSTSSVGFSGSLLPSRVMRTCRSDTRKGPLHFMELEDRKSPYHKPCQASASCVTPAPATACPRHALSLHWAGRRGSWGRREMSPEHVLSTAIGRAHQPTAERNQSTNTRRKRAFCGFQINAGEKKAFGGQFCSIPVKMCISTCIPSSNLNPAGRFVYV